jgi:DNA-binding LacI/PurR family transcriptional regulator
MAIGAISYLQTHGYHVPNDVSVIGFDNLQVCEIVTPKLTTICQDFETIGAKACEALMHMIESGERVLDPIVVDTSIVVRDSCIKRK